METLLAEIRSGLLKVCNMKQLPPDVIKGINLIDERELIEELTPKNIEFFTDLLFSNQPDLIGLFRSRILDYDENECCFCHEKPCGVVHVLAACPQSLADSRFYKRHDDVLEIIKEATEEVLSQPEWDVQMSCKENNCFLPGDIYPRKDKVPNLFALSRCTRQIFLVMLTVPWIENMAYDHTWKTEKYLEMVSIIEEKGYKVSFHSVEISFGGIPSEHLLNYLREIGLTNDRAMEWIYRICRKAIKGSQDIWNFWAREEAKVHPHIANFVLKYKE